MDGERIAGELGNAKAANVVLLGALSALIEQEGLAPALTPDAWLTVITERVPAKYVELNRKAFEAGRAVGASGRCHSNCRRNALRSATASGGVPCCRSLAFCASPIYQLRLIRTMAYCTAALLTMCVYALSNRC